MSNRRKAKRPWLGKGREKADAMLAELKGGTRVSGRVPLPEGAEIDGHVITAPEMAERVVLKKVPAVIHFKDWEAVDRDDDEEIGETVIYEDGTFDMIINPDISDEAKSIVNYLHGRNPGNFSIGPRLNKED